MVVENEKSIIRNEDYSKMVEEKGKIQRLAAALCLAETVLALRSHFTI